MSETKIFSFCDVRSLEQAANFRLKCHQGYLPNHFSSYLRNLNKSFTSTSDFVQYLVADGYSVRKVEEQIVLYLPTRQIFYFHHYFGRYIYLRGTNVSILNVEEVLVSYIRGDNSLSPYYVDDDLTIVRQSANQWQVSGSDTDGFYNYTIYSPYIIESSLISWLHRILPMSRMLPIDTKYELVNELKHGAIIGENTFCSSFIYLELGWVSEDLSKHKVPYSRRAKVVKKMVCSLARQKNLSFELTDQILRLVLTDEMLERWTRQLVPWWRNQVEWEEVPVSANSLYKKELHSLSFLLGLCGDVELNPGPRMNFLFKMSLLYKLSLISFILFIFIHYLNLSFISFSLLLLPLYVLVGLIKKINQLWTDVMNPKLATFVYDSKVMSQRVWLGVKLWLSVGPDADYSIAESLNPKFNMFTYTLLVSWLMFWACVPLSLYYEFLDWITLGMLPHWFFQYIFPFLVILIPGVDITDPATYDMTHKTKYHYVTNIAIPHMLVYTYCWSLEISWTSIPGFREIYISGQLALYIILVVLYFTYKKRHMKVWTLFVAVLIPFIPSASNKKWLLALTIVSYVSWWWGFWLYNCKKLDRKCNPYLAFRKLVEEVMSMVHTCLYKPLNQFKFEFWSITLVYGFLHILKTTPLKFYFSQIVVTACYLLLVYLLPEPTLTQIIVQTVVDEDRMVHGYEVVNEDLCLDTIIYTDFEREHVTRDFTWKVSGGASSSVYVRPEVNDFQEYSEVGDNFEPFYTPNFDQFLKYADAQVEKEILTRQVDEMRQKLLEFELKHPQLTRYKSSNIRHYVQKVSGKVVQCSYLVVRYLKSKRMKVKPAWMTLAAIPKIKQLPVLVKKHEKLRDLLPKKKFIMETLGSSIKKAKEVWNISDTKDRYLRPSGKACKQEPGLENLAREWKTQGANSFKYNSEEYIKSSISRYFEKPTRLSGSNTEAIKEAANALVAHNPKLYAGAELWSPKKILAKTVLKYSCQFPLTNNPQWKKKSDVVKALGKEEVLRTIADYIRSGHYFRSLHTVFLKLAVVNRPKIEMNPAKQRTITAQDWLNYSLGMFVCGSINKRFDFESNSAPFTPILTGGLVRLATRLMKHKYFACMDFTAADSYFSSLIEGVKEVRKLGYRHSYDFDAIANVLEAYYEGLETSVIINREQGRKYFKLRGFSTGHANTTPDNTIAEQLAMLMAWHGLTKRPFHEYYIYNDQPAYGDDNILGSSYYDLKTWNATNISKYIEEQLGIPCRVEWEGSSLDGATFLAKKFCLDEKVLLDLQERGIKTTVAIIQDEEKLRQNFTVNLKNPHPQYIWDYCNGYLLQCASLPHVYQDIKDYMDGYMQEHRVSEEKIAMFQKRSPRPTYNDVMLMTYAARKERKQGWVDLTPVLPSKIMDTYKAGVGHLAGQLQIFENLTRTLRQFIPDAPEDHTKPLLIKRSYKSIDASQFLLEAFIYYKADAPDTQMFKELCATSPYSTMLQPEIFLENLDVILPSIPLAEALTIPNILTLIFYGMNSCSKFWWNPIGWLQYLNKWISKFYLEANYFWWTQTGRSSFTLSKMVPKDPAYYEKRCAYAMAKCIRNWLPNFYFNIKPYAIDQMVSDFVITVPDAPRKLHPNWDAAMPQIAQMLSQSRHITLKARTASGKTYFLPQLLKDYFKYITILTVNNVLVKNNSTPGFSKVLHNQKLQKDAPFRVMTYGLWEAMKMVPREGEILLLDEFAERDESLYYAIDTNTQYSIAMSATPKVQGLKDRPFIEVQVPRVHKIYTHEIEDFEEAIGKCQELGLERWLFIVPNIKKTIDFAKQLNKTGLPATAVYSGSGDIPSSGHIVATTLVDSGVDIGNLDAVIDAGKSVVQINGQLKTVDSNESVIEQRQGRVGRRKDGHYFRVKSSKPTSTVYKECSFFTALFKPSVAEVFDIVTPCLTDISEPLPPLFLHHDETIQNTMNLAYYCLRSKSNFSDAQRLYYSTIAGVETKENVYIYARYQFTSMLFDKVLSLLDNTSHRFADGDHNEILYNGKAFINCKVKYSRYEISNSETCFVSPLTKGTICTYDNFDELSQEFQQRFSPLSEKELSNVRSMELCTDEEKAQIRKLFDL